MKKKTHRLKWCFFIRHWWKTHWIFWIGGFFFCYLKSGRWSWYTLKEQKNWIKFIHAHDQSFLRTNKFHSINIKVLQNIKHKLQRSLKSMTSLIEASLNRVRLGAPGIHGIWNRPVGYKKCLHIWNPLFRIFAKISGLKKKFSYKNKKFRNFL